MPQRTSLAMPCCCCWPAACQVHSLLYSANWDTRTAAAATIGLMAEAFPHHGVRQLAAASTDQADAPQQQQLQDLQQGVHITLQTFDLASVLSKGEPLLASGGQVGVTSTRLCKKPAAALTATPDWQSGLIFGKQQRTQAQLTKKRLHYVFKQH